MVWLLYILHDLSVLHGCLRSSGNSIIKIPNHSDSKLKRSRYFHASIIRSQRPHPHRPFHDSFARWSAFFLLSLTMPIYFSSANAREKSALATLLALYEEHQNHEKHLQNPLPLSIFIFTLLLTNNRPERRPKIRRINNRPRLKIQFI